MTDGMVDMDVTQILLWMVLALGGGFISVITWTSLRVVGKLDSIDTELRKLFVQLDHRITVLEITAKIRPEHRASTE